jgi:hypothetical protein
LLKQTTWDNELPHLSADPRFINSPLSNFDKQRLFNAHLASLRSKHLTALYALFSAHAPGLDTPFSSLPLSSIRASLPAQKLKLSSRDIEDEYERWQRKRWSEARDDFDALLRENTFLDFWGRAGKSGVASLEQAEGMEVKVENDDLIGENDGAKDEEWEERDVRAMASRVDVSEVERVLRGDKRYRLFDHVPEKRLEWVKVCCFFALGDGNLG